MKMRKTTLAFASVLIMLAAGVVFIGVSGDSDATDTIPAPERPGLEGYPITVFKQDGSKVGLETLNGYTATDGDEIWVYEDVSDIETYRITGSIEITIHLHYSTIEMAHLNNFKVIGGILNIEGTGTVTEKKGAFYYWPITMYGSANQANYSILNVGPGIELNGCGGVAVTYKDSNSATNDDSGVVINFAGKVKTGKDTGGYDGYAFYVNGSVDTVAYRPIINILPGAVLDGGDGLGIYAAGNAEWNINGATIIGGAGIELRAGAMTISNSTITGTSTPTTVLPNGNGSTTDGAGIGVAQHTTALGIDLTVNESMVSGYTAFYQSNPQGNANTTSVQITINSGTFESINGGSSAVYSQNNTGFINGGTFSSQPNDSYIASGKTLTSSNGKWFVSTTISVTTPEIIDVPATNSIVNADLGSTTDTSINMQSTGVKLAISGESGLGNIVVSAEQRTFTEAPGAAAAFEITIVTSTTYTADITVPATIPTGFKASAYYIDDAGNLVPVQVVKYTSSSVTFRTNHTTPFVIMTEEIVIPEVPGDDDEYPFLPGQGTNQGFTSSSDSSDDNTKFVAAAATVVVIMLAVVAIMTTRNH